MSLSDAYSLTQQIWLFAVVCVLIWVFCVKQSLHTKVVRQYQQHYRDGPPTSADEESLYWIRYLTYHMAKANLTQVEVIIIFFFF